MSRWVRTGPEFGDGRWHLPVGGEGLPIALVEPQFGYLDDGVGDAEGWSPFVLYGDGSQEVTEEDLLDAASIVAAWLPPTERRRLADKRAAYEEREALRAEREERWTAALARVAEWGFEPTERLVPPTTYGSCQATPLADLTVTKITIESDTAKPLPDAEITDPITDPEADWLASMGLNWETANVILRALRLVGYRACVRFNDHGKEKTLAGLVDSVSRRYITIEGVKITTSLVVDIVEAP